MWRTSLGDSNGLSLCTITKDEEANTYTVTRRESAGDADTETRRLWAEMVQADGGADFLTTRFVLGIPKVRVAESRWSPPAEDSITFACDITLAQAHNLSLNFPRG